MEQETATCVVAGRLAAADPNLSILAIEGGENNFNKYNVINPALYLEYVYPESKTAIFYKIDKSLKLNDRDMVVTSDGILGRGFSINLMLSVIKPKCHLIKRQIVCV